MTWENRYTFEVSSAAPDATPVWVDLSLRIRDGIQPIDLRAGRQDNTDQNQPSILTLLLDNSDDALTYGNTTSIYPWWAPGQRCRLRETIAGFVLDEFTGFTQTPDESVVTAGIDQKVFLTATDRLGAMENGRKFQSTLIEYVRYSGGTSLVAHWPMNDPANAAASLVAGVGPLIQVTSYNDTPANNQLLWATQAGPVGDDASYVKMNPTAAVIANNYKGRPRLARRDISVPLNAGTVVAFLCWFYIPVDSTQPNGPGQVLVSHANSFGSPSIAFNADIPGGTPGTGWTALFFDAAHGSLSVSVPAVKTGAWTLVGAFLDVDASTMTLYVDGQSATGSLGAPALTGTFQEVALDGFADQSFANLQILTAGRGSLGQAFFTAQYQMGLLGLERQSTGDRIRTLAGYAGIPNAEFANTIDPGSSVMQRARMAGRTALDLMREAETTEQGSLYVDGSGHLCFADRRTIYNV